MLFIYLCFKGSKLKTRKGTDFQGKLDYNNFLDYFAYYNQIFELNSVCLQKLD